MSGLILLLFFLFNISVCAMAQWTEPDSTWCPQPGPGAQAPWISNDNLRLYLSSPADIAVFERPHPDSAWGPLQILPDYINLTPTQRCPAESPTGDTLYFIGDARSDCPSYGSYDVFFTVRTDTGWGPVQNAGPNVSSDRREVSVGISRDGSTLLVASMRLGGLQADLYWHELQSDHTWGPANNFGPGVNDSFFDDEHPCLYPSNDRLIFFRRSSAYDDLWESHKVDGIWQQATRLPSPPNNWPLFSVDDDPCIAIDGRTLWFRQAQYTGYLYQIKVSVDTSVVSVPSRWNQPPVHEPVLSVASDSFGYLQLTVSGIRFSGNHEVELYDILGRLVMTRVVSFSAGSTSSLATLPSLELTSGSYVISLDLPSHVLHAKFNIVK